MVFDSGPIAAPVRAIAHETVSFLATARPDASPAPTPALRCSGAGLARLGRLLEMQLEVDRADVLVLTGRAVLEAWLGAHAAVLLGDEGVAMMNQRIAARRRDVGLDPTPGRGAEVPSLAELARRLDLALYGVADPPKAFQRHLRSFFDEVDVLAAEGPGHQRGTCAHPGGRPDDHVRVSLWVTLFLAHDHFAAVDRPDDARRARSLFDRLRSATDRWYADRRATVG